MINHPEKGSNPRPVRVSSECIGLLMRLPRKHGKHVFNPYPKAYDALFHRQRKRIADRLGKPQFMQIHFHTFRHVRGSFDVRENIPLFEVQQKLGHRYIANTEKYVHWNRQLYQERNDKYHFASASTDEEVGRLIETGWQYVCTNPNTKNMHFRKPK